MGSYKFNLNPPKSWKKTLIYHLQVSRRCQGEECLIMDLSRRPFFKHLHDRLEKWTENKRLRFSWGSLGMIDCVSKLGFSSTEWKLGLTLFHKRNVSQWYQAATEIANIIQVVKNSKWFRTCAVLGMLNWSSVARGVITREGRGGTMWQRSREVTGVMNHRMA